MRSRVHRLAVALLVCAVGSARSAAPENEVPAVWKARELSLDYTGFTSRYSCEGLRNKVEQALLALGARRDLDVTPYPCSITRLERIPSVQIKVSTLEPVAAAPAQDAVQAHWKTVQLAGINKLDAGDCELAEQIKRDILPLFTTRNLKSRLNCMAFQQPVGMIVLTVDVLVTGKD